ncbi:MerR family transcriptional regulator [Streptococcus cameli]
MSHYTTGEIAKKVGVTVRTVQYYDQRGLLSPSDWTEGGRRIYKEEDVQILQIIAYLRELDFSLAHIKDVLADDQSQAVLSTLLDTHIASLQETAKAQEVKIKELQLLRKTIQGETDFSLNNLSDISLTMKHHLTWRRFAGKQYLKLILVIALFIGLLYFSEWASVKWLAIPAAILYIGGLWYLVRNYYRQVQYHCPICHQSFKPAFQAFVWARHTPKTRTLTCPHCSQTSKCIELVEKT